MLEFQDVELCKARLMEFTQFLNVANETSFTRTKAMYGYYHMMVKRCPNPPEKTKSDKLGAMWPLTYWIE